MRAWVLDDPGQLSLVEKPVPMPGRAEVLVRIDAVAICATDLEIIAHGPPALIRGGQPFNQNFTPGHEYMGTVAALGPGVDEYRIGQRVTVEIHAGCGQCKRCREGMYTACLNYGLNYGEVDKGHRANGFTTDGGFAEYAVNSINTLVAIPDSMSDAEATLVVTAGTAMYGLTELGGLVAGEGVAVLGPGPIGLLGVAVAKALGASPVILTGTRDNRLQIGRELGADHVVNVRNEDAVEAVRRITGGSGLDYVLECSGAPDAINEAARMLNRGGRICLAAFPHEPALIDIAYIVRNNIYLYGIRGEGKSATHRAEAFMSQKRFDATKIHTHTFGLHDLPTALRYARERIDDAIKVVVTMRECRTGARCGGVDWDIFPLPLAGGVRGGCSGDRSVSLNLDDPLGGSILQAGVPASYSAATAVCAAIAICRAGAGAASRASNISRRASAFARFASFTGPKPRIMSGSSASATAVSSVSGRNAASTARRSPIYCVDQRALLPPLGLVAERIERGAAHHLAMPQHAEQRQRQPAGDRDLAAAARSPGSIRAINGGDIWNTGFVAIRRRGVQPRHLVFVLVGHDAEQPLGRGARQLAGAAEHRGFARDHVLHQRAIAGGIGG